jgi:CheY-like chemotaxis protein
VPASTILVLESADAGAQSLAPILTTSGYIVTRTSDPEEALAKVAEHQLAIIDLGKPPKSASSDRGSSRRSFRQMA